MPRWVWDKSFVIFGTSWVKTLGSYENRSGTLWGHNKKNPYPATNPKEKELGLPN
jgi:hypothetical protein